MAKLTLSDLSNLNNQTSSVNTINNNNAVIEAAIENTLSRDGTAPNEMNASLDMNSNRIINLPDAIDDHEPVTLGQLPEAVADIKVGPQGPPGEDGLIQSIQPGTGIAVDDTDPANPIVSVVGAGGDSNVFKVNTIANLKEIDTTLYTCAVVRNATFGGVFLWIEGDMTSAAASDPLEGVYVKATAVDVSVGMWARMGFNPFAPDTGLDYVDARWWGAIGDSNGTTGHGTNNSPLITAAYDFALSRNIQEIRLPRGTLRCASTITIENSVHIVGAGMGLMEDVGFAGNGDVTNFRSNGTWLYFDHTSYGIKFTGEGGASTQYFRFNSSVEKLSTMRNQPTPAPGWAPTAQGADFRCEAHMVYFTRIGVLNPTVAFDLWYAPCTFNHIRGQPLQRFCNVDNVYDVCRWHDIHLWPFWSLNDNVAAYTRATLIVFNLGRCDNPQFSNVFSIRQNTGIRITDGDDGGGTTRLKAVNCEFDDGGIGLILGEDTSNLIIELTNFVVWTNPNYSGTVRGIWIEGTGHQIHLVNTDISNTAQEAILINGSSVRMGVHNYRLYNYGRVTANAAGIRAAGTNNTVYLSGAEYLSASNSTVRFQPAGSGTTIVRTTSAAAV